MPVLSIIVYFLYLILSLYHIYQSWFLCKHLPAINQSYRYEYFDQKVKML